MAWSYLLSALVTALVSYPLVLVLTSRQTTGRSQAGPRPLPLIGNVHQLPTVYLEQQFARWARRYGDPVFARFFRTPVLIINTQRVARELLDKKGAIYNSRPRTVLFSEMMEWDSMVFLPYDSERRRKQRKWVQNMFNDKISLQLYDTIRRRETYKLLLALVEDPAHFAMHMKRFVAALLLEITYGHPVKSLDDPYFVLMDEATRGTSDGGAAAAIVDFFPFLRFIPTWMPGSGFKKHALKVRQLIREASHRPYEATKAAVMAGTAPPSFVATLIDDSLRNDTLREDERDIMSAAASVYGAGSDTTKATLLSFMLAMTTYPDVFKKAQAEIDRVVGSERLPQPEDRANLPYVESVISEVLRWGVAVPLGIPHFLTQDDVYQGSHVPKGSTVLANIWAMANDEAVYVDPSTFRPERFLGLDVHTRESIDPRGIAFGFGRRICPGRYFADENIFMAVANIMATLNITKARDVNGEEIEPPTQFTSGLGRHPLEFLCNITPRSQKSLGLVSDMLATVAN